MSSLEKIKKIIRTANTPQTSRWRPDLWDDQFRNGCDHGVQDAQNGYFGRTHRDKGFNYAYCSGYIAGWRKIKPGAWITHSYRRMGVRLS